VNPLVGSKLSGLNDYGKTVPGAVRPFGMLDWSPDTPDTPFYRWETPVTEGFSLTHISGPGCGQFGDVPVIPLVGLPQLTPAKPGGPPAFQEKFRHEDEVAEPGYYSVKLASGVGVQLAAQVRSGIAQFTFPADSRQPILFFNLGQNVGRRVDAAEVTVRGREVSGSVAGGGLCGFLKNRYRVYFAFELEQAPQAGVVLDAANGADHAAHAMHGAYLSFPTATRTVRMKVGLSYVSVANAEANLKSELPGWDLDEVRRDARATWNDALGHVVVGGGTEEDRRVFYTALYHTMIHPSIFSDENGDYIGFDGQVHNAKGRTEYTNFSEWDIYRSEVQLLAVLFPKIASDMAQSLVNDAAQGGSLPVFALANDEAHAMVGDPADPILADFYAFGARDFDAHAALRAMLRGANDPAAHLGSYVVRPELPEYLRQGYVADRLIRGDGAASVTLEYQSADFAISRMAAALGDKRDAAKFLERSSRWRTLFDAQTRYIRSRGLDGAFLPDFSPSSETGFVEGNAAQYTWMVPYDLKGVIAAVGGPEAATARLDDYFSHYYDGHNGPYFAIGNEPSFGDPWIYNWTGHPWRTQEVVRKTLHDLFSSRADGLPGNDDLGATSSWVVFAELGIYPEIPGVGGLTLHSPVFPEATLLLGDHPLRITAPGAPEKLYVQSVALDGSPVRDWWIDWQNFSHASNLTFTLGAEADHDPGVAPPSFAPGRP
jgi:predicted alpha-1,2-mannosidase